MKYSFIQDHCGDFHIKKMCNVFSVARSGYYSYIQSKDTKKNKDILLLCEIKAIYGKSKGRYGSPRVTAVLHKQGIRVNHKKVEKMMQENDMRSIMKRKFKATTNSKHSYPVAPDLLSRNFTFPQINTAWVSDITYVATDAGWVYHCAILDLASKFVVGWAHGERMDADLVITAIQRAWELRKPSKGLIFHSDRGVQYASKPVRMLLMNLGWKQSMSRKGNCWDNACAESFFATLKTEELYHKKFRRREEVYHCIFEYIEIFYNRQRLHSSIGYKTPAEFEAA